MIFHFACSEAELLNISPTVRDEAVRALLRAHRLGDHVIIIERHICDHLKAVCDLSNYERSLLERIRHEHTQKADLVRRASRYVSISVHTIAYNGGNAIPITLSDLVATRLLERSILLVENIRRDGLLYGELLKAHHDLHKCPIPAYEPMHGGGADLTAVFDAQISRKRIVCGVVDTDRYSPISASKAKFTSLTKIAEKRAWPFAFSASPPCREAENCVPMEVMLGLPSGQGNADREVYLNIAKQEEALKINCMEGFWLFVDLKDGIDPERSAKITDPAERDWIDVKLSVVTKKLETARIAGFGDKVFDQIADSNELLAELRRATRCKEWRNVFVEFLDFLLWIFAGGRRSIAT